MGHRILLHGRNPEKLESVVGTLSSLPGANIESYIADLSNMNDVTALAEEIADKHDRLDVLINMASVYVAKPNSLMRLNKLQTRYSDTLIRFGS